jgi:LacI family transcriptional regulator
MADRSTIREVAKLAGVSIAAVSRYLSGTINLPEGTAERIRDAIEKTNYSPHASARRLRSGRSEALGFVAPNLANPFFALLASSIASSAWELGLDLLVWNSEDVVDREVAAVRRLRASYIDGLVFISHHKTEKTLGDHLRGAGPIVLLDEDVEGVSASRVFVENEHGGWLATKTLISMGHSRIAHVGSPATLMSSEQRCKGWRKALSEAGLQAPDSYYISGAIDQGFGRAALERLMRLPEPPTAVFVGADPIAFGIIAAAHSVGLQIPGDLSIIAFDGLPIGELLDPPLSTIAQPIKDMGKTAVDLLVQELETARTPKQRVVLPITLEVRASAAPLRARSPAFARAKKA